MSDKPKLYMMCGVSGSGKTTWAKKFAEENNLLYLNPDNFYALYNGDERRHLHEFEIWMALYRALHMAEEDKRDCVFDTNAPSFTDRAQIIDWFPSFEHHLVCIYAPAELCLRNNANRNRVIPPEEMEKMFARFQMPGEDDAALWDSVTCLKNDSNRGFELMWSSNTKKHKFTIKGDTYES